MTESTQCPFCGRADELATAQKMDDDGSQTGVYYVGCGVCGTEGPTAESPEDAVTQWNTRSG